MSTAASIRSTRWAIGLLLLPLLAMAGFGLLVVWNGWSVLNALGVFGDTHIAYDTPTQLGSISVPERPNSLAWSADGSYLAAGATGETEPGLVYVVDVAKTSVKATLNTKSWVAGLAFSPDGKWLAVATMPVTQPSAASGTVPAELVLFDVPAFTAQFAALAHSPESGFTDIAWAADCQSLLAIDGPVNGAAGKAEIRRWDVPAGTEQPVVRALEIKGYAALAVSPDGRTLGLAEADTDVDRIVVRLLDLAKGTEGNGTEQLSFRVGDHQRPCRLGFTADGKAIGIFDTDRLKLFWRDVATGRPAERGGRYAVQPAGLSGHRSRASISPDGGWVARAHERHRGFGDLAFDNRGEEFGSFIDVTNIASAKSQTWRVSKAQEAPIVALAPDGAKLAGTVWQPSGASIVIWAAPK
jgi:DNA-binding beta-propeller fold protein YncE